MRRLVGSAEAAAAARLRTVLDRKLGREALWALQWTAPASVDPTERPAWAGVSGPGPLGGPSDSVLIRRALRTVAGGALVSASATAGLLSGSGGIATGFLASVWCIGVVSLLLGVLLPLSEKLDDWHVLLDGRAGYAETGYAVLLRSLRFDHQVPAESEVHRLRSGPPIRSVRNILVVRVACYRMYVCVFGFGQDLSLGWTLWRHETPARALLRVFRSRFPGRLVLIESIEGEPVAALRNAVHAALLRGVEAVTAGESVSITDTFGYDIPVRDMTTVRPEGGGPGPG